MKVALLYHEIPPFINGIGSYTYDLAVNLSGDGIDIIIITGHYKEDFIEDISQHLRIYRLKTPNFTPRFLWFQLFNKKKIIDILEKEKIEILHGQTSSCSFIFSDKRLKCKKLLTMHGTAKRVLKEAIKIPFKYWSFRDILIHILGSPLWYYLERKELNNVSNIIVFNKPLKQSIIKDYTLKSKVIRIIPQPIDLTKIRAITQLKKQEDYIIFGGRLIYIKGFTYLIEAISKLIKKNINIKLRIYGDGPLKKPIEKFITKNKLSKNISLLKSVPNEILIQEIKNSSFAILPSLIEAESVMMLEAMACKKPIIAFDLPFIQETLTNNEDSLLVKKDSDELAKAIIKLCKDKKLREKLGKNAYKTVKKKHDWNKIVDKYVKVYRSLLG